MALFYLVRHGEASYDHMLENGFWGFGRDFAPLSEKGKQQAEIAARDIRLKDAELIVSSPYTRAMQTAQIISRETGIRVEVDIDLHEWIPDENNQYETSEESFALAREFTKFNGEYPPGEKFRWETLSHMRKRMIRVADKFSDYDKVILVGHGMVFRCLTYIEKMNPAEIIECTYQKGQAECEYKNKSKVGGVNSMKKIIRMILITLMIFSLVGCSQKEASVVKVYEITDSELAFEDDELVTMVKYYEMSDGTWRTDTHTYKYRLVITGRMGGAVKDSTFVFLSNLENITFEQAWKASGFSSNMNDYFKEEDAKFVALK